VLFAAGEFLSTNIEKECPDPWETSMSRHGRWRRTFRAHPVLSLAVALLSLAGLVFGTGMWVRTAPAPASSRPSQSGDGPESAGRFGWQWCGDSPGTDLRPSKAAPTETGAALTVQKGSLNIEWAWCRSRSNNGLLIVYSKVTNTGDEAINHVLLDFSFYDETGSFIGNHSVTLRRLEAHGATKIEDTLPSQYAEWKWTAWSMRLASVDAN
jgi:hypothetical protein